MSAFRAVRPQGDFGPFLRRSGPTEGIWARSGARDPPIADPPVPPFHATGLLPFPPCPRGALAVPFGAAGAVLASSDRAPPRSSPLPLRLQNGGRPSRLTRWAWPRSALRASPPPRPIGARLSAVCTATRDAPPPRALRASPLSPPISARGSAVSTATRVAPPPRPSRLSPLSTNQRAGFRRLHGDAPAPPPSLPQPPLPRGVRCALGAAPSVPRSAAFRSPLPLPQRCPPPNSADPR